MEKNVEVKNVTAKKVKQKSLLCAKKNGENGKWKKEMKKM